MGSSFRRSKGVKDSAVICKPPMFSRVVEKKMRVTIAVVAFVVILIVGGLFVLAQAPVSPPVQKVDQVVPDDQIPR